MSSTLKPLPTDGGDALSKKIKAANWWFDQVYIPKRAKKRVSLFDYARAFQEALRAGGAYPEDLQAPLGTVPDGFEEVMRRVEKLKVAFGYEDREVEGDVGQRFVEYLYRAIEWEGCGGD